MSDAVTPFEKLHLGFLEDLPMPCFVIGAELRGLTLYVGESRDGLACAAPCLDSRCPSVTRLRDQQVSTTGALDPFCTHARQDLGLSAVVCGHLPPFLTNG